VTAGARDSAPPTQYSVPHAPGGKVALYLFLGALLVQLVYLSQYAVSPFFWVPELDHLSHDLSARAILAGKMDPRPYFRAPLYVYFLAGVYAVFGPSYWAARLAQALLQAVSVVLLWRLGLRAGVHARVATGAAAMMALSGPLVFQAGELHTAGIELFCNLLLLNLAVPVPAALNRRPVFALAAGLALGLSAVARPTVLTTVPILLWWFCSRWAPAPGSRHRFPFAAALCALFLLGAAALPGLATWRNWRTSGSPVFIASQGPIALWCGNRDEADGFTPATPKRYRFEGEYEDSIGLYAQRAAEEVAGRPLTVNEAQKHWMGETVRWWKQKPGLALGLLWKKWVLLWTHRELRNNTAFEYVRREWAPALWAMPFGFGIVGPLALTGIVLAWWRRRGDSDARPEIPALRLLSLWALVYVAGYAPIIVADRYRIPAVPVLILLAAWAASWMLGRLRSRDVRAAPALALLAGAAVFVNVDWWDTAPPKTWALDYWSAGNRLARMGRYPEAEAQQRRAAEFDPTNSEVWLNLGGALYHQRKFDEAEPAFVRSIRLAPDNASGYFNLAMLRLEQGRRAESRTLLETATRVEPEYAPARRELAALGGSMP